jgi:hypothetical protein
MSSLQKFHRRTNGGAAPFAGFTAIGSGNEAVGYWLGTAGDGVSKLIVAPKSTEVQKAWGNQNTISMINSNTDGPANTNQLYISGSDITLGHPAAHYCKYLTTGGYNTWYLPAKNELITCWSNHNATPFSISDSFIGKVHWTSTENTGTAKAACAWGLDFSTGDIADYWSKNAYIFYARATRRTTI